MYPIVIGLGSLWIKISSDQLFCKVSLIANTLSSPAMCPSFTHLANKMTPASRIHINIQLLIMVSTSSPARCPSLSTPSPLLQGVPHLAIKNDSSYWSPRQYQLLMNDYVM